ncbi:MAG: hypothetical protein II674_09050 [Prevotella sp.]|nr:hypothetical protein [Prevotella sp.]
MKKFLIKALIIMVMLFAVDRMVGLVMKLWFGNITSGVLGKDNYVCNHCDEEVLVFGSSRAEKHYNAKMMEEELGCTVYNCGGNGKSIILSYGRLMMVSERYHPKLIVLEVTPEFDIIEYHDNFRDLGELKRHYDREGIPEIFESINPLEKYKMMSCLYRYNSDFLHNPLRLFSGKPIHKNDVGMQGYREVKWKFNPMKVKVKNDEGVKIDSVKMSYFRRFVNLALEHSQLVLVVSPYWYGRETHIFNPVIQLADSLNVPFINFSNDPKYVHHDEFFEDGNHLNSTGASQFTHDLVLRIREVIQLENAP